MVVPWLSDRPVHFECTIPAGAGRQPTFPSLDIRHRSGRVAGEALSNLSLVAICIVANGIMPEEVVSETLDLEVRAGSRYEKWDSARAHVSLYLKDPRLFAEFRFL